VKRYNIDDMHRSGSAGVRRSRLCRPVIKTPSFLHFLSDEGVDFIGIGNDDSAYVSVDTEKDRYKRRGTNDHDDLLQRYIIDMLF
jgi:hypothetical protein